MLKNVSKSVWRTREKPNKRFLLRNESGKYTTRVAIYSMRSFVSATYKENIKQLQHYDDDLNVCLVSTVAAWTWTSAATSVFC